MSNAGRGEHEKELVETRVNSVLYRTLEREREKRGWRQEHGDDASMVCLHSFVVHNKIESSSRVVVVD